MAEDRIGGVYVEAYVKGLEDVERRLREFDARFGGDRASGGGTGGGGGGGYHVGGSTGGAPMGGGGYHAGSSGGGGLRNNPLLDDIFMGPGAGGGTHVGSGGGAGVPPDDIFMGGGGGGSRARGGGGGGWKSGPAFSPKWIDTSKPDTPAAPSMPVKWIDTSKPDTSPAGDAPNLGLMQSMRAKAQKELEKAGENAGEKLGLRAAWILRSASGGGPLGAAGGGLGALAGLAVGNPAFGALIGNMAGRQAGDTIGSADAQMDKAARAFPGLGFQRMRAEADAEAAEGRGYVATYRRRTQLEKDWADFYASGGKSMTGIASDAISSAWSSLSDTWLGIVRDLQGVKAAPGAGAGAAPTPMAGEAFRSGQQHFLTMASWFMRNAGPAGGDDGDRRPAFDRAVEKTVVQTEFQNQGWMNWLYASWLP